MSLTTELIDLAKQQIGRQLDTYNSLETKAIGLLAFDGAFGTVVAVMHPLGFAWRLSTFLFLAGSIAAGIRSLAVRRVFVGPQVQPSYNLTISQSEDEAMARLLTTLNDDYQRNNGPNRPKGDILDSSRLFGCWGGSLYRSASDRVI